jgi:hypothetical protein
MRRGDFASTPTLHFRKRDRPGNASFDFFVLGVKTSRVMQDCADAGLTPRARDGQRWFEVSPFPTGSENVLKKIIAALDRDLSATVA